MASQSEQLEQQSRQTRARISETAETLRGRMTAGQMVDQVADYARQGPVAEFLGNLGREVRDNPLPLTLIVTGIAWLIIARSLSSRAHRRVFAAERNSGDEIAIAAQVRDAEGDWAGPRLPQTPAMEGAHEG